MLKAIREFFETRMDAGSRQADETHAIRLATAALLVEMVRMDGEIDAAERAAIMAAVRGKFGLAAEEADALVRLAEQEARQSTDYYQFTSLLNRHFSAEQKEKVIEAMWRVAYADTALSAWEQHLVRKVADLLYVPHGAYVAAKMRAREDGGGPP